MMLIVERTGRHDSTDSFNLTLPVECIYYELSWAHYFDYYSAALSNRGNSYFRLLWEGLNTTINSFTSVLIGDYYKYGYYLTGQIEPENLYSVIITQNLPSGSYSAYTNVATVLIYHAS